MATQGKGPATTWETSLLPHFCEQFVEVRLDDKWDLTRRFDWYHDWRYPIREELFSGEFRKVVNASLRIMREEGIRSYSGRALGRIAKIAG
jgi:hypothetical protein